MLISNKLTRPQWGRDNKLTNKTNILVREREGKNEEERHCLKIHMCK